MDQWIAGIQFSVNRHTQIAFGIKAGLSQGPQSGSEILCVDPTMNGRKKGPKKWLWVLWAGWVPAPSSKWPTTQVNNIM